MEKKKLLWRENFTVRAYEAGPDARVTIQSVCNYLQEAAANHAHELGVSVAQLIEQQITWVLSRFHVRMYKYPFWRQQITVETWPSDKNQFYALRDFRLLNQKGEEIGIATSSWMLIDFNKRRPVIMPDFIEGLKNTDQGRSLPDPFDKLPRMENIDSQKTFTVRLSDLDMNQHVNNVNYIEWGLEAVPAEIWQTHRLTDVEISYRAESVLGDRVISKCASTAQNEKLLVVHSLVKEKDDKELSQMVTSWERKAKSEERRA